MTLKPKEFKRLLRATEKELDRQLEDAKQASEKAIDSARRKRKERDRK